MYLFTSILKVVFIIMAIKGVPGQTNDTYNYNDDLRQTLSTDNWTTCEEFLANTTFDRSKVVDIDWKIFYFWNFERENSYHVKFRVPSRMLIDRFRVVYANEINPPANWSDAVLFMETSVDFSALYIRHDIPGKFRLIPSLNYQVEPEDIPVIIFGLKYVEPGYLGIMNCKHRFTYALAPVDRMPKSEDLKLAAEKIGFHGDNGRSYLVQRPVPQPEMYSGDDDDDDENLENDEDGYRGNYIDDDIHPNHDDDDED